MTELYVFLGLIFITGMTILVLKYLQRERDRKRKHEEWILQQPLESFEDIELKKHEARYR